MRKKKEESCRLCGFLLLLFDLFLINIFYNSHRRAKQRYNYKQTHVFVLLFFLGHKRTCKKCEGEKKEEELSFLRQASSLSHSRQTPHRVTCCSRLVVQERCTLTQNKYRSRGSLLSIKFYSIVIPPGLLRTAILIKNYIPRN